MDIAQVNPNKQLVDHAFCPEMIGSRTISLHSKPQINLEEARRFVQLFGNGPHAYQTFDDDKKRKDSSLRSKDWYGTFDDYKDRLVEKNRGGAAIALCINQTNGAKRAQEHIVKIRALFLDTDGAPLQTILDAGLIPHMVIESSPGRYHCYWLVDDCPVNQFKFIMLALAHKFNCDTTIVNLCVVMRIPGFLHQKGEPFLSKIVEFNPDIPPYKTNDIISKFDLVIGEPKKQADSSVRVTSEEILICLDNNEDGDKDLFIRLVHGKFCYDHAEKEWYVWSGNYWKLDEVGEVIESTVSLADTYYGEAEHQASLRINAEQNGRDEKAKQHKNNHEKLIKRASSLQSRKRKENVIYLAAQGLNSLAISGNEWDRDPWLLPVKNGVIDLRDGRFRPGKQSDYVRTVAPVEWKGIDTPSPVWDKFLDDIIVTDEFKPDPETVNYLHRLLGYSITGLTAEHVFPILWGDRGRNGKGTLLQTLSYVIGPLAGKVSSETLLQSKQTNSGGAASPHLMAFRGKRMCFASETDQNRRLNISLIKELAGGDTISGRNLYAKHLVNFEPTHTLFLMTNNRPVISAKAIDPIWDRIILIPFHLKYVDEGSVKEKFERPKDIYLPEKLKAEAAGILAWLVRGCLAWQKEGLKTSNRVAKATAAYKKDEDVVGQFIEDRCVTGNGGGFKVKPGQIYKSFCSWCEEQKIKSVPSQTAFGKEFRTRYETEGVGRNKFYLGIRLSESEDTHEGE
jgi:putative DNA primase/helicase